MTLRIMVVDFWKGFVFSGSILEYLLRRAGFDRLELTDRADEADIIFKSVFGRTGADPAKTIFYTGENVRPNFLQCRYALSFDRDTWGGRNLYFPIWMSRIAWPGYAPRVGHDATAAHNWEALIQPDTLVRSRPAPSDLASRRFCSIVASAHEGLRVSLSTALSKYCPLDARGALFGRPLDQSKHSHFQSFKFALCPENSLFPGYVTEKLFDVWVGGAVPIYYGGSRGDPRINSDAFLNYADGFDVRSLVSAVAELDRNPALYLKIHGQPLLRELPRIEPAVEFMHSAVSDILS